MQNRNGGGGSSGMSKAEKFENEKKRIIESCFAKKDSDGSGTLDKSHKPRPVARAGAVVGDLEKYSVAEQVLRAGNKMAPPLLFC